MIIVPDIFGAETILIGVFDGTVGPDASDFAQKHFMEHLLLSLPDHDIAAFTAWLQSCGSSKEGTEATMIRLQKIFRDTFHSVDRALLRHCDAHRLHYASSTGVTACITGNIVTVAHLGDSKACIGKVAKGRRVVEAEFLTVDHKPNMPDELARITRAGGKLAWLHNGSKPYIRGGDFVPRQLAGEHPKQLNYSRAFGGKDLKMYGLSADPDVSHFDLTPRTVCSSSHRMACGTLWMPRMHVQSPCRRAGMGAMHQLPSLSWLYGRCPRATYATMSPSLLCSCNPCIQSCVSSLTRTVG